jgi:hypothetical protein
LGSKRRMRLHINSEFHAIPDTGRAREWSTSCSKPHKRVIALAPILSCLPKQFNSSSGGGS